MTRQSYTHDVVVVGRVYNNARDDSYIKQSRGEKKRKTDRIFFSNSTTIRFEWEQMYTIDRSTENDEKREKNARATEDAPDRVSTGTDGFPCLYYYIYVCANGL